jgi:hypothetical protein
LSEIKDALKHWLYWKDQENQAKESRQQIEDWLSDQYELNETGEGTSTFKDSGYTVKVVQRMYRKVDSEKVQQIAEEKGLQDHIPYLFRYKAEIDAKNWKNSGADVTEPFLDAITTTPGRPSFKVTEEEK